MSLMVGMSFRVKISFPSAKNEFLDQNEVSGRNDFLSPNNFLSKISS